MKKICVLEKLFLDCKRNPTAIKVIDELLRHTYSLLGSGGSYGFPLISEAADLIREDLEQIKSRQKNIDSCFLITLFEFIGTLKMMYFDLIEGKRLFRVNYKWFSSRPGQIREQPLSLINNSGQNNGGRVFVISDDEVTAEEIKKFLVKGGFDVRLAKDIITGYVEITGYWPDILILDINNSELSCGELCQLIRMKNSFDYISLIAISNNTTDLKIPGKNLNNIDFMAKPVSKEQLLIRAGINLQHSRVKQYLVYHDPLTGVYNHRFFHEKLTDMISKLDENSILSIALVEIIKFSNINETYGYSFGDIVLKYVASFFLDNLRNSDIITRYTGGKFGIIMPDTNPGSALKVLDRLKKRGISNLKPSPGKNKNFNCSFFTGIVGYPEHGDSREDIVKKAEVALAKAKIKEKNVIFGR